MSLSATRKRQGAEDAKVGAFCAFQKSQITKAADGLLVSPLIGQPQLFFQTLKLEDLQKKVYNFTFSAF